jgi:phospholipid/cholesterol/gamma-HCH transport system permease protein
MNPTPLFRRIGSAVFLFFSEVGSISLLLSQIVKHSIYAFRHRHLVIEQMVRIGVESLPLITVMSIFTGAVSSWQASYQFQSVIPGMATTNYLGAAVSAAILIELSPVLTGIVISGRAGASIAAELGTMKVTEQIDALETLAIDPVGFLALPRFTAGWCMLPVLVVYSYVIAHIGAYAVAFLLLGVSTTKFFTSVQQFFMIRNVFGGLIKALVFGGGTALIGCSIGFRTEGGAEGVGRSTIKAFVMSAAFILVADFILATILF